METNSSETSFLKRINRNQFLSLFAILFTQCTSMMILSIMGPFFPLEASKKGMSQSIYGLIFAEYGIVQFLFSPIIGRYVTPFFGAKKTALIGITFTGISTIAFGLLNHIKNLETFTLMCFITRFIESFGTSMYFNSVFTLQAKIFPEDIALVCGLLYSALGLGLSLGAPIGGFLYHLGGYGLPFYFVGFCQLINLPIFWFLVTSIEDTVIPKSFLALLKIPKIIVISLIVAITAQSLTFIGPTLEPYLRHLNVTPVQISFIMFFLTAMQSISAPIVGSYSRKNNGFIIATFGQALFTVAFLFIGPSIFFSSIHPNIWLSTFATGIIGIAFSLTTVAFSKELIETAKESGFENNLSLCSLIAGLWCSANAIGELSGPIIGSWFSEHFGLRVSSTIMSGITLSTTIVLIVFAAFEKRKKMEEIHLIDSQSSQPLLKSEGMVEGIV